MMQEPAVGARQIKAARALLDWSQQDLADATHLSVATIRKLEMGSISPRHSTNCVIQRAIENAGLEFIQPDGVRRRPDDILVHKGPNCLSNFLEDLQRTIQTRGGDVAMVVNAPGELFAIDKPHLAILRHMAHIGITIRCLFTELFDIFQPVAGLEFRSLSPHYVDPAPFCTYGDKHAVMTQESRALSQIVVIQSAVAAQASRRHFNSMWDKATILRQADVKRA